MADLLRPLKSLGTRRFQDEYALGQQFAKDYELDADLDTIYLAWNTMIPTMLQQGGAAGGDLSGFYPDPEIRPLAVGTTELANGAVTDAKVTDVAWTKITGAPTGAWTADATTKFLIPSPTDHGILLGSVSTFKGRIFESTVNLFTWQTNWKRDNSQDDVSKGSARAYLTDSAISFEMRDSTLSTVTALYIGSDGSLLTKRRTNSAILRLAGSFPLPAINTPLVYLEMKGNAANQGSASGTIASTILTLADENWTASAGGARLEFWVAQRGALNTMRKQQVIDQDIVYFEPGIRVGDIADTVPPLNGMIRYRGTTLQARVNGAWATLGFTDAPSDGQTYGRKNAAWSVVTGGGGGSYFTINPTTGNLYINDTVPSNAGIEFDNADYGIVFKQASGVARMTGMRSGVDDSLNIYGGPYGVNFYSQDENQIAQLQNDGGFFPNYYSTGETTRTLTAGANNDVNPGAYGILNVSAPGFASITGISGGVPGRLLYLFCTGSQMIDINIDNALSVANNRIQGRADQLYGATDPTLRAGGYMLLRYYGAPVNRWRIMTPQPVGQMYNAAHIINNTITNSQLGPSCIFAGNINPSPLGADVGKVLTVMPGVILGWSSPGVAAPLTLVAPDAATIPLTVQGFASQTADLFAAKNSGGTSIARITASGGITGASLSLTGSVSCTTISASTITGTGLTVNANNAIHFGSTRFGHLIGSPASSRAELRTNIDDVNTLDDASKLSWAIKLDSAVANDRITFSRALPGVTALTPLWTFENVGASKDITQFVAARLNSTPKARFTENNNNQLYISQNWDVGSGAQDSIGEPSWLAQFGSSTNDTFLIRHATAGGALSTFFTLDSAGNLIGGQMIAAGTAGNPILRCSKDGIPAAFNTMGLFQGQAWYQAGGPAYVGAQMNFYAQEAWTPSARGTSVQIVTTPAGTTSASSTFTFDHQGNLVITGPVGQKASGTTWQNPASDERVKDDIADYAMGLDAILGLRPRTFTYNGKGGTVAGLASAGFVAQEVEPHMPDMVTHRQGKLAPNDEDETDILGLDQSNLVLALVNAVKELTARVVALEAA